MFTEKNNMLMPTPIQEMEPWFDNQIYIKREDLLPFSFGGNKARKAFYFFQDIIENGFNAVATYGSSSSNHCRIIANLSARYNMPCYIISPEEDYHETANSKMVEKFGAYIIKAPVTQIKETINELMTELSKMYKPYFIQGGGHGNLGTEAYVDAYNEIVEFEKKQGIKFDYIFHATGTGTTQAGLVCGAILNGEKNRNIIGISIARFCPRGKEVVEESIRDYLKSVSYKGEFQQIDFDDSYICGGYSKFNREIVSTINQIMEKEGIPLNTTYTGKAFWGMREYIRKHNIKNKKILFIHTGGTPLYFDDIGETLWIF